MQSLVFTGSPGTNFPLILRDDCCDVNVVCPSRVHVLGGWPPGAVQRGGASLEGLRSMEELLLEGIQVALV